MRKFSLRILGILGILFVVSCKPTINTPRPSAGLADFSQFISIGNSLTAGFADGGLYLDGQKVAFPNLVAMQMKLAGGGTFTSPFFDIAHANGSGYLRLKEVVLGFPIMENISTNLAYRDAQKHMIKYTDPIQNLGVPGMRIDLAFSPQGSVLNSFFERLLPEAEVGIKTYVDYVVDHDHTFFSFFMGSSEVLGYAAAGGVEIGANETMTEKAIFDELYTEFVDKLTEKQQKGVVATVPDLTTTPFFTTVNIDLLVSLGKAVKPEMADQIKGVYIQDKTAPGIAGLVPPGVREATKEDLIVLTFLSSGLLGKLNSAQAAYGFHPLNPIEDHYVLDKKEALRVKEYVESYNVTIRRIAKNKGLAIADVYTYLNQVKNGVMINGATLNAEFITGGVFSLDGVHLTPKGNALIANLFIRAINETYVAKLPEVDVNSYRGVKVP